MFISRKKKNKIWAAFSGMILALMLVPQSVQAAAEIEVGVDVSLKIEYHHDGTKIEGATFDIYKVAEITEDVEFLKTEEFEDCEETLENLEEADWSEAAKKYADFAESDEAIEPFSSGKTDSEGIVSFPNGEEEMTTGLYLVVGQECEIDGVVYKCDPFFICLPNPDPDGEWIYDLTATPKVTTDTTDVVPDQDVPKNTKLPQTGMLLWPIPVLAGVGLVFFMIGWAKRQKSGD